VPPRTDIPACRLRVLAQQCRGPLAGAVTPARGPPPCSSPGSTAVARSAWARWWGPCCGCYPSRVPTTGLGRGELGRWGAAEPGRETGW